MKTDIRIMLSYCYLHMLLIFLILIIILSVILILILWCELLALFPRTLSGGFTRSLNGQRQFRQRIELAKVRD